MKALVTGATGFIGSALCRELRARGHHVRAAVRRPDANVDADEMVCLGDITDRTDWSAALQGVDIVFHLAGLAHQSRRTAPHLETLALVNTRAAAALAAAAGSVDRLVFLSTIKIHGEASGEWPFREADPSTPEDQYAASKWEAELAIRAALPSRNVTVVRTPLVYGPNVRANFLSLVRLVDRRVPLPLGAIRNQRSLIYVRNLTDALVAAASSERARGETFLVSDGRDLSTVDLVHLLGAALHRKPVLLSIPVPMIRAVAALTGRQGLFVRVAGNLQADITRIRSMLGWEPPHAVESGIADTVRWYRETL